MLDSFSGAFNRVLLISASVILPLTLLVGVLATFKVAGPIYSLRKHLTAIRDGEDPGPWRLREKDLLKDLCQLTDEALASRAPDSASERAA